MVLATVAGHESPAAPGALVPGQAGGGGEAAGARAGAGVAEEAGVGAFIGGVSRVIFRRSFRVKLVAMIRRIVTQLLKENFIFALFYTLLSTEKMLQTSWQDLHHPIEGASWSPQALVSDMLV